MVSRAREILECLRESEIAQVKAYSSVKKYDEEEVIPETKTEDLELSEIISQLKSIEVETLSPIEAMNLLYKLCKTVQDK